MPVREIASALDLILRQLLLGLDGLRISDALLTRIIVAVNDKLLEVLQKRVVPRRILRRPSHVGRDVLMVKVVTCTATVRPPHTALVEGETPPQALQGRPATPWRFDTEIMW